MDALMNLSIFQNDDLFINIQPSENCTEVNTSLCSMGNSSMFSLFGDFQTQDSVPWHLNPQVPKVLPRKTGTEFFAYCTPFILAVGIVGNCLSFAVFVSKNMRKSPASIYLAALAVADTSTLAFYVLIEWFRRGLTHINPSYRLEFLEYNGVCHILLFLAYTSRVMSAWIIVIFTIERFTGVCYPMRRFKRSAKRIICIMLILSCLLVCYKPILSGSYTVHGITICAATPSAHFVSFILDSIYAFSITLIPFLIITILNCLIVRKLFLRNRRRSVILTEDMKIKQIKLEFTFILLAISIFFIAFNLPYFIVWSRVYLAAGIKTSDMSYWIEILNTSRTIFYMNYCINFFLYSITGVRFRSGLCHLFLRRTRRNRKFKNSYIRSMRFGSSYTQATMLQCSSSSHFPHLSGTPSTSVCTTYSA